VSFENFMSQAFFAQKRQTNTEHENKKNTCNFERNKQTLNDWMNGEEEQEE
ncbi:MAG: hypothetical protein ACI8RD_003558, partial [Bacillariaceae sp.]|jgi:hypothetical protein